MTDPDLYETLRQRPDVVEIDPRTISEGMVLIGNREMVDQLQRDFIEGETGSDQDPMRDFVVDAVLGMTNELTLVGHGIWVGTVRAVRCGYLLKTPTEGLRHVSVDVPYDTPVLIREAD